ncbi:MAG: four helix bundle protein [Candidatus Korobacteraceae bacterium]
MKDFRDLTVWQRAHEITLAVYRCTRSFPREETYGMSSQLRRCSSSVAANIAEGCGRSGNPEFARFLTVAMGSASELEYFLLLAKDLEYLGEESHGAIAKDVGEMRRMLNRLISKVQAEARRPVRNAP